MDFLFENPFARMYGPDFLVWYFLAYILVYVFLRFALPQWISSDYPHTGEAIPDQPDPYKIAFMRRGEIEVLIFTLFSLMRRSYISIGKGKSQITIRTKAGNLSALNKIEKTIYDLIGKETPLVSFIKSTSKSYAFILPCDTIREELASDALIWSEKDTKRYKKIKDILFGALIVIGFYKMTAGVLHGHSNILGLLLVSGLGSYLISRLVVEIVPTKKGLVFMDKLKVAFKPVSGNNLLSQPFYMEQVLVAVYGFSLLKHSKYMHFYTYLVSDLNLKKSISLEASYDSGIGCSSGSGCGGGSSCSGGGSGCGSSCGGGCGGCGGCS